MDRIKKEKSILGAINDLSHRLVLMLVFPIIISLVLMLFYAWEYHSAIQRMGRITELKTVVADEIPEKAWNIVSGRETFPQSNIYKDIIKVNETIVPPFGVLPHSRGEAEWTGKLARWIAKLPFCS